MSLTPEWRGRIEKWRNTLRELFYIKLADVPLEGFTTMEQLTPREAARGRFRPMPPGTPWGAKWEYSWFRGSVRLPAEAKGEMVVLRPDAGGESRVLINGREAGGRDWFHADFPLIPSKPGARFDILIEAYAGHGETPCGGGPALHGIPTVPEPPAKQRTVGASSFGIWEEEAYQAWIDVQTLVEVRDKLDANSLRVAEIDEGLRDFTLIADLELPREAMVKSIRAARERLRPLLACTNGTTAPLFYCHGHSHIDVAWLWPLAETERKCARTFAAQLGLMHRYPEYKFLQSQAHLYWMAKRLYPELYQRIKQAAKRGQWIVEGGMWVEPDTNIISGESLVRQFMHGKRFFRDEFGVESELMWLPDVFGYSGAIPQIMAGCRLKYFSTAKILWIYAGGDIFPHNTFWWEGIDGTRVLAHLHADYNAQTNPATLIQRWAERQQKDGITARLLPFGWGDGGGGPTRDHLEFLRRQRDLEGSPRTVIDSPVAFFKAEEARNAPLPVYVGELYYQAHRGTYTTQARTKKGNRTGELALREAELWAAAAGPLAGFRYPAKVMEQAWRDLLLNQFHDIIPGSSIRRVYEEAEPLHAKVIATARDTAQKAQRTLVKKAARSLTVFNSLSWERTALVPLPKGMPGAAANGSALPAQRIGGRAWAEVRVPSCGWVTLSPGRPAPAANALKASPKTLENELLRLAFNARGDITSCVDKQAGFEFAAAPLNSLRMYKDVPQFCDAWDIDSMYKRQPVEVPGKADIEVIAEGPLAAALRIRRALGASSLTQEVWLRRNSRRVEFRTSVDWHEKHRLLKVNFPLDLHANEAIHEIQFGYLPRPNHASRQFDADRYEVVNQRWTALAETNRGAAVLNDCKYGVNVEGGCINLTLLRSPQAPDMLADQGLQEFTYALLVWRGGLFDSGVVREAAELNVPVTTLPGSGGECSLFSIDAANVAIDTVKPAEDGSGDVVVRLYESLRAATRCTLKTSLPVKKALATDMLEDGGKALPARGGAIALEFRPFEIKTLRLTCEP